MKLERKAGTALWRQVGEALAAEITSGLYAPGALVPAEPELVERFGVSRHTVRRAMSTLEQRGLVRVEQGRGTFVHEDVLTYAISRRTRFSENLLRQGRAPRMKLLNGAEVPASEETAQRLGLLPGDAVFALHSLDYADDTPISVTRAYFDARRFPGLLDFRRRTMGRTTDLYAAYGIADYTRLKTWISARLPTDEEARQLRQPRSQPVLVTDKIDIDARRMPISCSTACWAADRVNLLVDGSEAPGPSRSF